MDTNDDKPTQELHLRQIMLKREDLQKHVKGVHPFVLRPESVESTKNYE